LVKEVPNVFSAAGNVALEATGYDVLFILRPEPVKNPTYPFRLYLKAREQDEALNIGVIGLDEEFLSPDERAYLHTPGSGQARIEYLGRLPFEAVGHTLEASKALILPSHSEGVPKAALEALVRDVYVVVDYKLRLPSALSGNVIRTDLEDWPAMLQLIKRLNGEPRANNAAFAHKYLVDSIATLDRIYADLDKYSADRT
jgi:hypothetical protein